MLTARPAPARSTHSITCSDQAVYMPDPKYPLPPASAPADSSVPPGAMLLAPATRSRSTGWLHVPHSHFRSPQKVYGPAGALPRPDPVIPQRILPILHAAEQRLAILFRLPLTTLALLVPLLPCTQNLPAMRPSLPAMSILFQFAACLLLSASIVLPAQAIFLHAPWFPVPLGPAYRAASLRQSDKPEDECSTDLLATVPSNAATCIVRYESCGGQYAFLSRQWHARSPGPSVLSLWLQPENPALHTNDLPSDTKHIRRLLPGVASLHTALPL